MQTFRVHYHLLTILCFGFVFTLLVLFFLPHLAHAQADPGIVPPSTTFHFLSGIPYLTSQTGGQGYTLSGLANALYKLAIIVGALLAVVQIAIGGFQWMGNTLGGKEEGRARITNAIFGLLILLTTALILQTIFGNVNLNALGNLPPIRTNQQTPPSQQPSPTNSTPSQTYTDPAEEAARNQSVQTPTPASCDAAMAARMNCPAGQTATWLNDRVGCRCQ